MKASGLQASGPGDGVGVRPAEVLRPTRRAAPQTLGHCLQTVRQHWTRPMARLSRQWSRWAGATLAARCRPLSLHGRTLTVAVDQSHWLQAVQYSRHQLLGRLQAAGFAITELRLQQRSSQSPADLDQQQQQQSWDQHPSRGQMGKDVCPRCNTPTPQGELQRWGHCCFCQRSSLPPPRLQQGPG
ncbi:MAG: DUF721 domain-containing protein [Synechococcus sp. SB0673_bin_10]|nr:DUF721 domain-containing protein [Synechococcus sp. SB0667_bin_8]MXY63169.1 DUF721 domain-containing protein [Synechococcus sp. SB0665_bin_28]MYF20482.1 DUF721 domain-containing protein [Synechococcus sp. SB0677_bin_5]MYG63422.1 DUF721 domain-containing protein [Synechococcus sp. SB0675_bin_7]MYI71782.1 DUF721 domain-containing protein [Synechococcus sp. SB0673_bin_10]MYK86301.1 DUF721 domain-containing protein [Synechococcus sp. SB0669_bin_7]